MRFCYIILLAVICVSAYSEDTISVFTLHDGRVIRGEVVSEGGDSYQVRVAVGSSSAVIRVLRSNIKSHEVVSNTSDNANVEEVDNSPEGVFVRNMNENISSIFEIRQQIEDLKNQIEDKEAEQRDIIIRYAGPLVSRVIQNFISNPPERIADIDEYIRVRASSSRLDLNRVSKYRDAIRSWNYFAREISSMGRMSEHMLNHLLRENRVELRELGLLDLDYININDSELRMVVRYVITSIAQDIETEERLERERIQRQLDRERKREADRRKRKEAARNAQRNRRVVSRQLSSPIGK